MYLIIQSILPHTQSQIGISGNLGETLQNNSAAPNFLFIITKYNKDFKIHEWGGIVLYVLRTSGQFHPK